MCGRDPELGAQVELVGLDGLGADAEGAGDVAGVVALADQLEDLELAVAEAVEGGLRAGALAEDDGLDQRGGEGGADSELAAQGGADRI